MGPPHRPPAAPGHRLAGPAHRRPLRRSSPRPATSPSCGAATGLVLDPYFSATKLEWLLTEGGVDADADLAFGTSTPGCCGTSPAAAAVARHRRRPTPAARCSTTSGDLALVGRAVRPVRRAARRACPRSGRRRAARPTAAGATGLPGGIPVTGIAGDQQAALFGQACFDAGHDQEHLRHRLVRADERRARPGPSRSRGCSPRVGWTLADGDGRLRARGRDLRHRRRRPVAARRPRHHRRGGRDRAAGRVGARHRRRLPRARVHRPGQPVVGPLRPGHDRGHHPGHRPGPPGPGGRRGDGVPDPRRGRRHARGQRARRCARCGSTAAPRS